MIRTLAVVLAVAVSGTLGWGVSTVAGTRTLRDERDRLKSDLAAAEMRAEQVLGEKRQAEAATREAESKHAAIADAPGRVRECTDALQTQIALVSQLTDQVKVLRELGDRQAEKILMAEANMDSPDAYRRDAKSLLVQCRAYLETGRDRYNVNVASDAALLVSKVRSGFSNLGGEFGEQGTSCFASAVRFYLDHPHPLIEDNRIVPDTEVFGAFDLR